MASSFIEYKDNGFWIYDRLICLVGAYIVNDIEIYDEPQWYLDMKKYISNRCSGYAVGWVSLGFNEFLDNDEKRIFLIKKLKSLKKYQNTKGDMISIQELNDHILDKELQAEWDSEIKRERVTKVIDFLIMILELKQLYRADSKIDYSF